MNVHECPRPGNWTRIKLELNYIHLKKISLSCPVKILTLTSNFLLGKEKIIVVETGILREFSKAKEKHVSELNTDSPENDICSASL